MRLSSTHLTKRKLLDLISARLSNLGYAVVPGPPLAASLTVYKIKAELVLTLGVEFSSHYAERFTASFYLGRSFHWAYIVNGFPARAYTRIGHFLTSSERAEMLEPEFTKPGVVDAWWVGFTQEAVSAFIRAVELAEPRFMSQDGIEEEVRRCDGLLFYRLLLDDIIKTVEAKPNANGWRAQPKTYPTGVPSQWFHAAEQVVSTARPEMLKERYVSLLAVDAWRVAAVEAKRDA